MRCCGKLQRPRRIQPLKKTLKTPTSSRVNLRTPSGRLNGGRVKCGLIARR